MAPAAAQAILVVGGGISGLTAAIEAAEAGHEVYLVEKNPYLGGHVAQFYQYFPKLCPPSCGLEINFRRIKNLPRLHVMTMAEVARIEGEDGSWQVTIDQSPRYVNGKCTSCGKCTDACTLEIDNPFNCGMDRIKAAYLPHDMAFPQQFVLDPALVKSDEAQKVKEACPYDAIELEMKRKKIELKVASVVWATGWKPYDMAKLETYGAGKYPNVINNVMMERLASRQGPTQGKIQRPSDGRAPRDVAFVQCAGSRDENHLAYCSSVCCMAAMKQAMYVRAQIPDARITIFFIDIRAMDRLDSFYQELKRDEKIRFFKGKVAKIDEEGSTNNLVLRVEDTNDATLHELKMDLVVLATGMQPNTYDDPVPAKSVEYDDHGFISPPDGKPGIYPTGCTRTPGNVSDAAQDGTGAALKAIQSVVRR
ncbi:MAG: CoB--CoM heterodisulfide reductase iron-sulfur subunit A family protein [Deltaproteobacteria bacterium]|nr:CoB--CoM heterodisulfide reductase iron-sulfur subunit A family protein [Deltaproteobacteria bacterium]